MGDTIHTFGCYDRECPERDRGGVRVTVRVAGDRRPIPMIVCPYCRTVMTAKGREHAELQETLPDIA